jgi:hypothetical protein
MALDLEPIAADPSRYDWSDVRCPMSDVLRER